MQKETIRESAAVLRTSEETDAERTRTLVQCRREQSGVLSVDEPTRGRRRERERGERAALVTRAKAYVSTQNETRGR